MKTPTHSNLSLKQKIYDEVTEDIFDMSNVRIFKEIERKKWGMFILCYVIGQLSSVTETVECADVVPKNVTYDITYKHFIV